MSPKRAWAALAAVGLLASRAGAASSAPEVDLRALEFQAVEGLASFPVWTGGYAFGLEALSDASGSLLPDGGLSWSSEDGIGIDGSEYEPDEIEGHEILRLSFAQTTFVHRLLVSDLFIESVAEAGAFSLDGGLSWTSFAADGLDANGEVEVRVDAPVDRMLLRASGRLAAGNQEFALIGFDAGLLRETPEPAPALLVSGGLLLLGLRRRR